MPDEQKDSRGEARQSFFAKQLLIGAAKTAFQQLSAILKNVTIYPSSHPFLLSLAEKLVSSIEALLVDRKEVAFYFVGGELFFETHSVPIDQGLVPLMEQLAGMDVGGIVFKPGLTTDELTRLAGLLSKEPSSFAGQGGFFEELTREALQHIDLHRVTIIDKKKGATIREGKKRATEVFLEAIDAVKEMVQGVHLDKTVNMRRMNTVIQTMVDTILDDRDTLLGLTNLKMYDEYTFAHSVNTAILAISLGTFLSFEKPQIAALGVAAVMHDIGKVRVPLEIINKPGKLTEEEWAAVKRHPVEGALILTDIPGMTKMAMVAAFEHHQHGGPQGYPKQADEFKQHLFSQIVSLSDAYEALTAARVYYSSRIPVDQAVRILMKKRGSAFHPILVKAFVNMMGIFPIGSLLKLDTNETGLVMHQTRDLLRPRVLLLTKFDGSEKNSPEAEVSLLETVGGKFKRTVVGTMDPYVAKLDLKKYAD